MSARLLAWCGVAALLVACRFDPLDLQNRLCPCVAGWSCDTARGVCLPDADAGVTCDLRACTSTVHGVPSCMGASCGWSCDPGFAHCADGDTGCSVETTSDPIHCGSCTNNCNAGVKNATAPTCAGATCTYTACAAGFLDCDGDRNNGCESESATDAKHCGGCATDCTALVQNAAAVVCNAGVCDYSACAIGFADCDTTRTNGCECACGKKGKACCPGMTCTGAFTCGTDNLCN